MYYAVDVVVESEYCRVATFHGERGQVQFLVFFVRDGHTKDCVWKLFSHFVQINIAPGRM